MRLSSQFIITVFAVIALFAGGINSPAMDGNSDPAELKRCWSYSEEKVFTGITVDGTTAYVATNEAQIVAISLLTGEKLWAAELGGTLVSNLEVTQFGLHLVTQPAGKTALLWRLSKDTGIPSKPVETADGKQTIASVGERLIAVSSSGKANSYEPKDLTTIWNRVPTGAITGQPFISSELIAFATGDGKLIKMSTLTGEIISTQQLGSTPTRVFASLGGLVFGNERGELVSVDPDWKFRTGAAVNGVSSYGEALLVTSYDNFVYLIRRGGGDVLWKKRLEGRVAGTFGIDESRLAVFSLGAESGYVVETKKGRTTGVVTLGVQADSIVVGPPNSYGPVLLVNGGIIAFSKNGCKTNGGAAVATPPNSKK